MSQFFPGMKSVFGKILRRFLILRRFSILRDFRFCEDLDIAKLRILRRFPILRRPGIAKCGPQILRRCRTLRSCRVLRSCERPGIAKSPMLRGCENIAKVREYCEGEQTVRKFRNSKMYGQRAHLCDFRRISNIARVKMCIAM